MRTRKKDHSSRHEDEEDRKRGLLAVKSRMSPVICKNHGNQHKESGSKGENCNLCLVESTVMTEETSKQKGKNHLHVVNENTTVCQDVGECAFSGPPSECHDKNDSFWEDGDITKSSLGGNHPDQSGLTIEFDDLPSSSQRKTVRRASAKEKELSEIVHKVHLLCLLARGRLVDNACNDPLIQASLLSLIPQELLKLADVPKLTTNMLSSFARWFNDNFKVQNSESKEESLLKNLAFSLGTHNGTAEEMVALSVALFRALNIPARFVSILDVASLKPESSLSGSRQDGPMLDARATSSVKIAASLNSSLSSFLHLQDFSKINSPKGKHKIGIRNLTGQAELPTGSDVAVQQTAEISGPSTCPLECKGADAHTTLGANKTKRRGDLEFELQLEMALTSTAVGVHNNGPGPCLNDQVDALHQITPKKLKVEGLKSSVSTLGDQGAVWSRRTGPPMCWAEVYCSGEGLTGRWVHVDVTNAIVDGEGRVEAAHAACRKPLKYVVAFAGNGAKDVTRRYCTQWYKVGPHRVCSEWWDAVLAPLKKLESQETGGGIDLGPHLENISWETSNNRVQSNTVCESPKDAKDSPFPKDHDSPKAMGLDRIKESKHCLLGPEASSIDHIISRNSLEDMELETRALTEPLPTNQQAYRNHPLYAIEKWLTKYQILYPKGPILGYCSGHPVYPRDSVQVLQTEQKWRRDGFQVKAHEVPAKVIKRSPKYAEMQNHDELSASGEVNHTDIDLYGRWQLEPLQLPHAVDGIVPKNERGQVDVWSEKCLPPGTVHLKLPGLVQIAKRLGIDFAPAMVGFDFRSGRALPVFEGIVVCTEYKETILTAYDEEEDRRKVKEKRQNEAQALSRWYQLISSMVTRQRLSVSYGGASSYSQSQREQRTDIPQSTYVGPTCALDDNHEHTFPLEDQHFDEETSVRTKRCPCGFSIELEEL